jgi:4-hydroxymandelate synthase
MKIQGIDHVEFRVGDARRAAADLEAGFGFRVRDDDGDGAQDADPHQALVIQGGIRLRLVSSAAPGDPVDQFVGRHGDGVAVIALRVPDARAAYQEALDGGAGAAPAAGLAITGFGDVALSFVDEVRPPESAPQDGEDLLSEIDHFAICVPAGEMAGTVRFCEEILGLRQIFTEYINIGSQGMDSVVVQSPSGAVTFTLLEPDTSREPGQIDGFLRSHQGVGVQHLAFRTEDIALAVRTYDKQGVGFLTTPAGYYDVLEARLGPTGIPLGTLRELNVLVDRDHGGQLFQIFTRSVHERRTFFFELIERRGARTFGTSNIKALYEAVERQQSVTNS